MYTFCVIVGNIIPKSVKCTHSATKFRVHGFMGSWDSLKHRGLGVPGLGFGARGYVQDLLKGTWDLVTGVINQVTLLITTYFPN